jgi:homoserine kinase
VREHIYEIVTAIEGHGDNAAPAVWGGLMAVGSNGPHALEMNGCLVPIVGIPNTPLSTKRAREVVPSDVSLAAAARNASRAILLVEALRTGDPAAFDAAEGDEFHEEARGPLSPVTTAMIQAAREAGALHAAWSGAGPTTLALATEETKGSVVEALSEVLGGSGVVRVLAVDYEGLR